jgi:mannitol-1-/sugar-/sorbitol-6-phosphatase
MAHAGILIPKPFVTAETVTHGKPHPEPYIHGAALLGASPEDCLVVEDAPAGVGSGKAAGCPVLAVLTTYPAPLLMDANWRVPTLAGVRADIDISGRIQLRFDSVD